nr:unnamed protein product [Digitaria exilis]
MALAGSLLIPWVEGLVAKAADALVQRITSMWGVEDYRSKLERQLLYVRSLLADAEEKAEANTEAGRAVKAWMKKLKAAAYEADEAEAGESTPRKVLYFSRDRVVFHHKASRDLKNVLDKIEDLAPQVLYQQTHSALDETADIFGRDNDREVVVKLLLDQEGQQTVQELQCLPRLRYLRIWGCSKLEGKGPSSEEEEEILPLPRLERLDIVHCQSLLQIPKLPASLEIIRILETRNLVALPSNLGDLAKLRSLNVSRCSALEALPDGMDGLTSLEVLVTFDCPGIEKFPKGLLQRLPALKYLLIRGCPDLQRRCIEGGEYFDLIASIPGKDIQPPAMETQPWQRFLPSRSGGSRGN